MSETEIPQGDFTSLPEETPHLEKHKHTIAIVSVGIATFLAGIFFYYKTVLYFNSIDTVVSTVETLPDELVKSKNLCTFQDDGEAYSMAREKADLAYCDCIESVEMKETCLYRVQDVMTYNTALKQMNPSMCNEIKETVFKDSCSKVLASSVKHFEKENPQYLADVYAVAHSDEAILQYESLLEKEPNNVLNLISLSLSYAEKGLREQEQGRDQTPFVEKALATIEKAKTLDEKNPEVFRVMAYAYEIQPDYAKSQAMYNQALDLKPDNILALVGRGHVKRMMGILEGALEDFKRAAVLDTQKEHENIYTNICNLEFSKGNRTEAVKNCLLVTEKMSADPFYKSEAHQILATIYLENGEVELAQTNTLKAKILTPNDPNVYITSAKINIIEKKFEESEVNARTAIELAPTKAGAYLSLSQAEYMQDKFEDAIQTAEKGLDLVDNDVSLLNPSKGMMKKFLLSTISFCYRELGNVEKQKEYEAKANAL